MHPTALANVMEEAESVAPYCSNANSAVWHEGLMNEECVSTVQGEKNPQTTKGEMKDIKYWCARQEWKAEREYERGSGESQYEHWLEKCFGQ